MESKVMVARCGNRKFTVLMEEKLEIPEPSFLPNTNFKVRNEAQPPLSFLLKPNGGRTLPIQR